MKPGANYKSDNPTIGRWFDGSAFEAPATAFSPKPPEVQFALRLVF